MKERILWGLLLLDFVIVSLYLIWPTGANGLLEFVVEAQGWGLQVTMDLVVALTIGTVWMWKDARSKGINPLPYAVMVPLTGSIGLLMYLAMHGVQNGAQESPVGEPAE